MQDNKTQYRKYFCFLHWRLVRLGGQRYWGQYEGCSSAPLPPPGFSNHTAADRAFWLGCSHGCSFLLPYNAPLPVHLHSCVIPYMLEISFKRLVIAVVQIFPLTFDLTEYVHCYGKGSTCCISAMLLISNSSTPNRETEAHQLELFARDCTACEQQDTD